MNTEVPLRRRAQSLTVDLAKPIWMAWTAFALITMTTTRTDPDLWGHVRFGLDWLRTRTLPAADPYSFTQDRPWINHEWLSEALMGAAYLAGGAPGLVVLKMTVIGMALIVLLRRLRGCTPLMTAAVLSLAIVCVLPTSLTVRPQLWSVLGLVVLLSLLDRETPPDPARIVAGAALFALWANLHGGWITGTAVLGVYTTIRIARERRHVLRWAGFAAASVAGTLVNPYGIGLWRFLATTVRASRPDIGEWGPLTLQSPKILWFPLIATSVVAFALSRRAESRSKAEVWAVLALLIAGAVRVLRVAPLMGPAALVLLAPGICRAWGQSGRFKVASPSATAVFWIPAVVALVASVAPASRAFSCLPVAGSWAPDRTAAAYLRGARGRLVTTFDWGEYAIWHFGPDLQVSVDGRRETVYSDSVVQWHRAFERGDPKAQKIVAGLAPHYVWLPASRAAAKQWLLENGYRVEIDTGMSFVARREGTGQLAVPRESLPACFP
ncbi:MAG: hypothetical protein LC753_18740 [Acidobacteria bacterium]|nr:hypothetical protein [Acidobacteriota bacterium]MCA1652204.1 hypothetical protein [Acidobacteriota bacterium]